MMSQLLLSALVPATLLAIASAASVATAETNFPSKPVKIILPLPPGSALDVITRVAGEGLTKRWGLTGHRGEPPGGRRRARGAGSSVGAAGRLHTARCRRVDLSDTASPAGKDFDRRESQFRASRHGGLLRSDVRRRPAEARNHDVPAIRRSGKIQPAGHRGRHEWNRIATELCRSRDREEGEYPDHRGALCPGWHARCNQRHHGWPRPCDD